MNKKAQTITAVLLSLCLLWPQTMWAFESMTYASGLLTTPSFYLKGKKLALPDKWGSIASSHAAGAKTIVLIQDLHCNEEVQHHIAAIISYLAQHYGLSLVGEEGAHGKVDVNVLRTFPIPQIRQSVSDYFLSQGKLTGAEYGAANGARPVDLVGLENDGEYQQSLKLARGLLNAESQGYCQDLRGMLDQLKAATYNPRLSVFDRLRSGYQEGRLDLTAYARQLGQWANRMGQSMAAYSELNQYLASGARFQPDQGDLDQLFVELDQFEKALRQKLYTSEKQRTLDHWLDRLDLIEKMLNLSATQEELQRYRQHRDQYQIPAFIEFIRQAGGPKGTMFFAGDLQGLEGYLKKAETFYHLADRRSRSFAANVIHAMNARHQDLAVVITGGFHAKALLDEIEQQGFGYVSIKPRLTKLGQVNPYFSILQGKRLPIEKLLAKNQTMLAPPSWPQQGVMFSQSVQVACGVPADAVLPSVPLSLKHEVAHWLAQHQEGLKFISPLTGTEFEERTHSVLPEGCMAYSVTTGSGAELLVMVAQKGMILPSLGETQFEVRAGRSFGEMQVTIYGTPQSVKQALAQAKRPASFLGSLTKAFQEQWPAMVKAGLLVVPGLAWANGNEKTVSKRVDSFIAPTTPVIITFGLVLAWLASYYFMVRAKPGKIAKNTLTLDKVKSEFGLSDEAMEALLYGWSLPQRDHEGWKKNGLFEKNGETVAGHTWGMGLLYLLLEQNSQAEDFYKLIVHDDPEVLMGDPIPHDQLEKEQKRRVEAVVLARLFAPFPNLLAKLMPKEGRHSGKPEKTKLAFWQNLAYAMESIKGYDVLDVYLEHRFYMNKYPEKDHSEHQTFAEITLPQNGMDRFLKLSDSDPLMILILELFKAKERPDGKPSLADETWRLSYLALLLAPSDLDLFRLVKMAWAGRLTAMFPERMQDEASIRKILAPFPQANVDALIALRQEYEAQETRESRFLRKLEGLNIFLPQWLAHYHIEIPSSDVVNHLSFILTGKPRENRQASRGDQGVMDRLRELYVKMDGSDDRQIKIFEKDVSPEVLRTQLGEVLEQNRTYEEMEKVYPGYTLAGLTMVIKRINGKYHLLFCRRGSGANQWTGYFTFPGGRQEKDGSGETPGDTSLRELEEEVGLRVEKHQGYLPVFTDEVNKVASSCVIVVLDNDQEPALQPNHELDKFVWIPIDTIMEKNGGEIQDRLIAACEDGEGRQLFTGIRENGLAIFKDVTQGVFSAKGASRLWFTLHNALRRTRHRAVLTWEEYQAAAHWIENHYIWGLVGTILGLTALAGLVWGVAIGDYGVLHSMGNQLTDFGNLGWVKAVSLGSWLVFFVGSHLNIKWLQAMLGKLFNKGEPIEDTPSENVMAALEIFGLLVLAHLAPLWLVVPLSYIIHSWIDSEKGQSISAFLSQVSYPLFHYGLQWINGMDEAAAKWRDKHAFKGNSEKSVLEKMLQTPLQQREEYALDELAYRLALFGDIKLEIQDSLEPPQAPFEIKKDGHGKVSVISITRRFSLADFVQLMEWLMNEYKIRLPQTPAGRVFQDLLNRFHHKVPQLIRTPLDWRTAARIQTNLQKLSQQLGGITLGNGLERATSTPKSPDLKTFGTEIMEGLTRGSQHLLGEILLHQQIQAFIQDAANWKDPFLPDETGQMSDNQDIKISWIRRARKRFKALEHACQSNLDKLDELHLRAARELGSIIRAHFPEYSSGSFKLSHMLNDGLANCVGYASAFAVLAGRLGLKVAMTSVEKAEQDFGPQDIGHAANLLTLPSGKMVTVDVTWNNYQSEPFSRQEVEPRRQATLSETWKINAEHCKHTLITVHQDIRSGIMDSYETWSDFQPEFKKSLDFTRYFYTKKLDKNPKDDLALLQLGYYYSAGYQSGNALDIRKAIASYEESLTLRLRSSALARLGSLYHYLGADEDFQLFCQSLLNRAAFAGDYLIIAKMLTKLESIAILKKALDKFPGNLAVLEQLGRDYFALSQETEDNAIKAGYHHAMAEVAEKYLGKNPENAWFWNGYWEISQNEKSLAGRYEQFLNRIIRDYPLAGEPVAVKMHALTMTNTEDGYKQAVAMGKKFLLQKGEVQRRPVLMRLYAIFNEIKTNDVNSRLDHRLWARRQGNVFYGRLFILIRFLTKELLVADPTSSQARKLLARIYQEQGTPGMAILYLKDNLKIFPRDKETLTSLIECRIKLGQWTEVLTLAERLLSLNRFSAEGLLFSAHALLHMKHYRQAMQKYNQILQLPAHARQPLDGIWPEIQADIRSCQNALGQEVDTTTPDYVYGQLVKKIPDLQQNSFIKGGLQQLLASPWLWEYGTGLKEEGHLNSRQLMEVAEELKNHMTRVEVEMPAQSPAWEQTSYTQADLAMASPPFFKDQMADGSAGDVSWHMGTLEQAKAVHPEFDFEGAFHFVDPRGMHFYGQKKSRGGWELIITDVKDSADLTHLTFLMSQYGIKLVTLFNHFHFEADQYKNRLPSFLSSMVAVTTSMPVSKRFPDKPGEIVSQDMTSRFNKIALARVQQHQGGLLGRALKGKSLQSGPVLLGTAFVPFAACWNNLHLRRGDIVVPQQYQNLKFKDLKPVNGPVLEQLRAYLQSQHIPFKIIDITTDHQPEPIVRQENEVMILLTSHGYIKTPVQLTRSVIQHLQATQISSIDSQWVPLLSQANAVNGEGLFLLDDPEKPIRADDSDPYVLQNAALIEKCVLDPLLSLKPQGTSRLWFTLHNARRRTRHRAVLTWEEYQAAAHWIENHYIWGLVGTILGLTALAGLVWGVAIGDYGVLHSMGNQLTDFGNLGWVKAVSLGSWLVFFVGSHLNIKWLQSWLGKRFNKEGTPIEKTPKENLKAAFEILVLLILAHLLPFWLTVALSYGAHWIISRGFIQDRPDVPKAGLVSALPEAEALKKKAPDRAAHLDHVDHNLDAALALDAAHFSNALPNATDAEKAEYARLALKLIHEFLNATLEHPSEKLTSSTVEQYFHAANYWGKVFVWAQRLHDMGFLTDTSPSGHEARGAKFADHFLKGKVSPAMRRDIVRVIGNHTVAGMVRLGETRLGALKKAMAGRRGQKEIPLILLLFHNFLDSSAAKATLNIFNLQQLKNLLAFEENISEIKKNFARFRILALADIGIDSKAAPLTGAERRLIWETLVPRIFGQEKDRLCQVLQDKLDLKNHIPFLTDHLAKLDLDQPDQFKRYVKFIKLLAQIAFLSRGAEVTISSDMYKWFKPGFDQQAAGAQAAAYLSPLLDEISDQTTIADVRRELERTHWQSVFGIPLARLPQNEIMLQLSRLSDGEHEISNHRTHSTSKLWFSRYNALLRAGFRAVLQIWPLFIQAHNALLAAGARILGGSILRWEGLMIRPLPEAYPEPLPSERHRWEERLLGGELTYLTRNLQQQKQFQERVLPLLIQKHRADKTLRFAVLGRGTGEEAATLLAKIIDSFDRHPEWDPIETWDIKILGIEKDPDTAREARLRLLGLSPFAIGQPPRPRGRESGAGEVLETLNRKLNFARRVFQVRVGDITQEQTWRGMKGYDVFYANRIAHYLRPAELAAAGRYLSLYTGQAFVFEENVVAGIPLLPGRHQQEQPLDYVSEARDITQQDGYLLAIPGWARAAFYRTTAGLERVSPAVKRPTPYSIQPAYEKSADPREVPALSLEPGQGASYFLFALHCHLAAWGRLVLSWFRHDSNPMDWSNQQQRAQAWRAYQPRSKVLENNYIWLLIAAGLVMGTWLADPSGGVVTTLLKQWTDPALFSWAKAVSLAGWLVFAGSHYKKGTPRQNIKAAWRIFSLVTLAHLAPLWMVVPWSYIVHDWMNRPSKITAYDFTLNLAGKPTAGRRDMRALVDNLMKKYYFLKDSAFTDSLGRRNESSGLVTEKYRLLVDEHIPILVYFFNLVRGRYLHQFDTTICLPRGLLDWTGQRPAGLLGKLKAWLALQLITVSIMISHAEATMPTWLNSLWIVGGRLGLVSLNAYAQKLVLRHLGPQDQLNQAAQLLRDGVFNKNWNSLANGNELLDKSYQMLLGVGKGEMRPEVLRERLRLLSQLRPAGSQVVKVRFKEEKFLLPLPRGAIVEKWLAIPGLSILEPTRRTPRSLRTLYSSA